MATKINIGLRHILAIYPLLAIVSAFGASAILHAGRRARIIAVALLLWQIGSPLYVSPDFLGYFNAFGASGPERILVDSDLDWGQDLTRLTKVLETRRIETFSLSYHGTADPNRLGILTGQQLVPNQCTPGWIAISIYNLKMNSGFRWLERFDPIETVGTSIKLYHIPKDTCHRIPPRSSQ